MKYLDSSPFSVGYTSRAYRDNWERIFGKKKEEDPKEEDLKNPNDDVDPSDNDDNRVQ